ncbi:MAG: hypothetical protein WAP57_12020 [Aquabacterium commune]|uniref:hypothetical protein n=1 Tax=Aquabacterium commune TaxID=70586 RepID=UPI003BB07997
MYGYQPPAARRLAQPLQKYADGGMVARMKSASTTQPQRLADGGFVSAAKRMMGLTPEDPARAARLAEYKANAEREKAAANAASAPATAPAPQAAISQYSGMSAMQRREKEQGLADGGMIRGPGTGTSDSIPDEMEPGTYIMPADSTRQLGLDDKKVPVRVSNGEYELPPEQVQAVGAAVLDAIKGVTHTPKSLSARGLQSPQDEQFFATGGSVRDPEELRKMIPQVEAMGYAQSPAAAPAPVAAPVANIQTGQPRSVSPSALYMQDRAGEMREQAGAGDYAKAAGTAARTAVQGLGMYGVELADKVATPIANAARSFGSGLLGSDANATPATPSTIASPPTSQTNPAAAPASTSLANAGRGVVNPPTINPSAPAPSNAPAAAPEVMPGVYRHGRGQYSDNAAGMGMPANFTGQPSAQNMAAGESLAARSQQASMGRALSQPAGFQPQGVTAPTVLNSSNSWQARNDLRNLEVSAKSITNNGGRFDPTKGRNPAQAAYLSALQADAAARGAQPGLDQTAMRENAGIQREGMQQEGATTRTGMTEQGSNARESGRNILARDEFNLRKEASGFQTRAAQQQEQLRNVLLDPKSTPEQRAVAQRNLAALSGKTAADRMQTVTLPDTTNEMGQVVRGGQALVRTLEDGTVQQVPIGAQQGAAVPPGMTKQVGTSNGRPVYEDAKGNRFVG